MPYSPAMAGSLLLIPRILWLAMLGTHALYLAILVMGLYERPPEPPDPIILVALAGAALGTAVASFVVPAVLRKNAGAPVAADPDVARRQALSAALTPFILSLALSEAVSVMGLVVGFNGHPAFAWAPFLACGALLVAVRFPTEGRMLGAAARPPGVIVG